MQNLPTGRSGDPIGAGPGLQLRLYPDAALRTICNPIERFDSWLLDLLADMLALMRAHEGIGLAAPQVGIAQRLFVAEIRGRSVCLVNPEIAACAGADRMLEGCLSLPGVQVDIERDRQVEVQGYDAYGRRRRHCVQGLWARVVQHEIDHLNGVLICDKTHQSI